jgi:hypothetical protein
MKAKTTSVEGEKNIEGHADCTGADRGVFGTTGTAKAVVTPAFAKIV